MKRLLSIVIFLALVYGCAPRVTVDRNSRADFSKYKTFAWMDTDVKAGQNPLYYNQIATENVENTMGSVLQQKGLKETTSKPDLLIGYHFFVENKTQTVANPSPMYGPYMGWGRWGYGGWGPGWWGYGGQQYTQQQYQAGTLVVDMVDARTRQLVWRGSVQNAVSDPARIAAQLQKEAERIAEKFPDRTS